MKLKLLLALTCIPLLVPLSMRAAKTVYIPSTWVYNSSTQEYTEDGNSDLQWSYNRSKQSDNCIVFWAKGFGTNPKTATISFDPDAVLTVAEAAYAKNITELGFSCSNMLNKYKLMILVSYTNDWVCYGGGYDYEVSALWIGPSAVNPAGHSLAHEVGHSFHYMCYAAAANYNHNSSSTINTGFHLACGNGQAIWEQTAQWQANQSYPEEMFNQSYPLFGNNVNYAFSHEWMRYQSYWFHYYLSDYYSDKTIVSQIWKQPMTGQSEGNATDFCQAYMALKGLSASQFYERYFDYALHCATYDFTEAASYRDNYIGNFDYHAVQLSANKYQVAYQSCPQSTGFNVIELNVPSSGTTITTKFTALQHGCALADGDPGNYNNGVANASVSAGVTNYNSEGTAAYRGFRVGYVFLKSDGTRAYYNDNTVHCTGTAEVTENISTTVPANTSRIFLVVAPALTTYVKHLWDENILNDDQWPYQFELENVTAKNVTPIIKEPDFTKAIDGRSIADVTLTYNVVLPPTNGYDGATVNFSGSGLNALATAFQMEGDNIFNTVTGYAASQGNGTIMDYAVAANGTLQTAATNTNGDFGHWFNASGTVADWGNNTVAFIEFTKSSKSASVGQFPGANSDGQTRTIREAFVYKKSATETATAYLVFNITFQSGLTSGYAYLSDIDYTEPAVANYTVTAYRAYNACEDNDNEVIALQMTQGASASYTLTSANTTRVYNTLTSDSQITSSTYFKGYAHPLSSQSTSKYNIYYYALTGTPTAESNASVAYYQQASVTNDSEYSGQYTYYYDANGSVVGNESLAKLKVAYDRANMTFTVKATDDCPAGTYTVCMAMAKRMRSGNNNRIYVSYFPINITVEPSNIPSYTYDWTLTEEEFAKTSVELRRSGNYDTDMDAFFQTNLGLTASEVQTKLSEMGTYNQNNNGVFTVGYAGGNVPNGYLAYYPLDADGNLVTTNSTTFNDYGWWFNEAGLPCLSDGSNRLAMCLDWIAHEWVLQQNPGTLASGQTYSFGVSLVYNNAGTTKRCNIFFNVTTPTVAPTINWIEIPVTVRVQSRETESASIGTTDAQMTDLGLTWEEVRSKLISTHSTHQSIGVANHTLATDEVMLYPASQDGTVQTNGGTTYGDYGYWFNGDYSAGTANEKFAVCLDWNGYRWVVFQNTGSLTAGDTYTVGEALVYNDGTETKTAYIKFIITVEEMPSIVLADTETSYEQQSGNYNVTLQRSLPAGKWLTFCAPFNIGSSEWEDMGITKVMKLNSVTREGTRITLNFTEVTDGIWVGIPVIIQMAEDKTGITKTETGYGAYDFQPVTEVTTADGTLTARFIGTYVKMALPNDVYYIQNDQFYHTNYTGTAVTNLKGWRGYFTLTDTTGDTGVKSLGMSFDGEPTLINDLDSRSTDTVDIYSVSGVKVRNRVQLQNATKDLPAGIYIVGGRKVIIK